VENNNDLFIYSIIKYILNFPFIKKKKKKKKKKRLGITDEINALIEYYKKLEILLEKKESKKVDLVEFWLKYFKGFKY